MKLRVTVGWYDYVILYIHTVIILTEEPFIVLIKAICENEILKMRFCGHLWKYSVWDFVSGTIGKQLYIN